ncbi:MAG TPA: polysaccharide deacetylase family protein [Myxococcales bacterium]|nr:polysaccharide deacetylase family protein [Myxococcales bacterium]
MIFSVSVDLDGLGCYAAIHGLDAGALSERELQAVPVAAVSRLCELFSALRLRATFFAIGGELGIPGSGRALRAAADAGHEVGSHSHAHDYALSRQPAAGIDADLERAERAILDAVGKAPRGFRAPGYTLSPALLEGVRARGYLYDSSLLPSPPYYAAKAAAIALHAFRGRRSRSILGGVGQLFSPRGPHWRGGVRELPVATLPVLRTPVIGTVVLAAGERIANALARAGGAGGHLNLELHGIDALDASDAGAELAAHQPGLRLAAAEKLRRLRALLDSLRARAESLTLEQSALRLLPRAGSRAARAAG